MSVHAPTLAARLDLPEEDLTALRRAGVVHDIGKVVVPDVILLKKGRLTPEEMAVVREHPAVGERICSSLQSFRLVLPIIRHHHEKLDGTGYPDGLRGEEIPLTARVLQIVDVYDALMTTRPYKPALSMDTTLGMMQEEVEKGWWDPDIFKEFTHLLEEGGLGLPAPEEAGHLA